MKINTIHIFSKPISYYQFDTINVFFGDNDVLLLIGDACYAPLEYAQSNRPIYALKKCVQARSVLESNVTMINDQQWVKLINEAQKSITW
jgi:tRNA 2-thiouridine synthesizing protein B